MFAPVKKQKVADQVAEALRDAILGGQLAAGESLPSERELAQRFEVNRQSVREALLRLEVQGLVDIRQGEPTRVRDVLVSAGLQVLPFLIAPGGRLDAPLVKDLLEMRVLLLGWTGERAARRATPADVGTLRELVAEMDAALAPKDLARLDWDFFQELVRMADNRVLSLVANAIRAVHLEHEALFRPLYRDFDTAPLATVVAALEEGDATRACDAMRAHAKRALEAVGLPAGEEEAR